MVGYPYSIRDSEVRGMVLRGVAKVVGHEGLQERPIVQYYGATYVKGIKFNDSDEPLYYRRDAYIEQHDHIYWYKINAGVYEVFPRDHLLRTRSLVATDVTIEEAYLTNRLDIDEVTNDVNSHIFVREEE